MFDNKSTINKEKTSYFKIKTQFDNVGDALINRELIKLCASMGDVVVDVSSCPPVFSKWLDLNSIKNVIPVFGVIIFWFRLFTDLIKRKEAYFFINPGGYIGEISRFKSFIRILNCLWFDFLRLCGVKICLVGVSYESLGKNNLTAVKFRAKTLHFHGVRDSISEKFCKKEGIKSHRVEDLAFGCDYVPKKSENNSSVVISMRDDTGISDVVVALLTKMNIKSEDIYLSSQVERDTLVQERINSKFLTIQNDLGMVDGINNALDRYAGAKYVVSNRLHVLLLAWFAGAIPIALIASNKNQKIRGIFRDLKMEKNIVEYNMNNEIVSNIDEITRLVFEPVNPNVKANLVSTFSKIFLQENSNVK